MALKVTCSPMLACLIYSLVVLAEISTTTGETVKVSTIPVYSSISEDEQELDVLVRMEAPTELKRRALLDLVVVLDVSSSMNTLAAVQFGGSSSRSRLDLLKRAIKFVIGKLDDGDRLAIVAFNDQVVREHSMDLLHVSGNGRSIACRKVDELMAGGGKTALEPGLDRAFKILDERSTDGNRVGSIILLSDGGFSWGKKKSSIRAALRNHPVHTFGLGADHDPEALRAIAEATRGGTYSFVDDEDLDGAAGALAVCLGGLKTAVAVDARVRLRAAERSGVRIRSIEAGGHRSELADDRTQGAVVVGALYAGEVKNFIVRLHVPAVDAAGFGYHQQLLDLSVDEGEHNFHAAAVDGNVLSVHRAPAIDYAGRQASPAVVNHIVRFQLVELVSRFVLEELDRAVVLDHDLGSRLQVMWERFKDDHRFWVGVELARLDRDMGAMASSLRRRRRGGAAAVAYIYSWVSSYQTQRATTMGSPDKAADEFLTPEMRRMLKEAKEMPLPVAEPRVRQAEGWTEVADSSAVTVGGCSCDGGGGVGDANLERIDRRLELWSKLKGEVTNHLTPVLTEASLDAINRAMHHDMYLAVVQASNVRRCNSGRAGGSGAAAAAC
ncbi:hypothetical protein ACP4OV_026822 [Aristida adscensionis]